MTDSTDVEVERLIQAYPYLLRPGQPPRYTPGQLRVALSERCEHGFPVLTICDCGSGDFDCVICDDCL